MVPWLVAVIFLINGYQTDLSDLSLRGRLASVVLAGMAIGLLLSPFIGVGVATFLGLPAAAAMGLVVIASMPPTLSSGIVLTAGAGGNTTLAVLLTISLNLAGIFTVPFVLDLGLSLGTEVSISPWPLLTRLLTIVLLPFVVGTALRRVRAIPLPAWARQVPSTCIILTVWMSLSASRDALLDLDLVDLLLIAAACVTVHGILLALSHGAGRGLRLDRRQRAAVLFVVSQKTLPVAVSVLTGFQTYVATALVVCIVFHFLQLMLDSLIAPRLRAQMGEA